MRYFAHYDYSFVRFQKFMMKATKLIIFTAISLAIFCFDFGEADEFGSNDHIAELLLKLDAALETIEQLKEYDTKTDIVWHNKITMLQSNIGSLSRELHYRDQISLAKMADWEQRAVNLTRQIDDISVLMLITYCSKYIQNGDFDEAEDKLIGFEANETIVASIVNRVYNGRSKHIRLLNDFGESLKDIELRLKVYKPLAYAIRPNTLSNDMDEIINLALSVDSEINALPRTDDNIRNEAIAVKNKLRHTIEIVYSEVLKDAILNNKTTANISLAVFHIHPDLFFDAITIAMDSIYGKVPTTHILDYIRRFKHAAQGMDGYAALFYKMKNANGNLHTDEMVELAFYIHEYRNRRIFIRNSRFVLSSIRRFEKLKDELPKSLSVLAFSKRVCIKNNQYPEYLFVGADTKYDQRYAFTSKRSTPLCQARWKIERKNGKLSIKNAYYNEYLFISNDNKLFTWIPKYGAIRNSNWRIISTPSGVMLQTMVDESTYITASMDFFRQDRRHVIAANADERNGHNDHWELEECDWKCNYKHRTKA